MGYAELGRALEEEAGRQVADLNAEIERAAAEVVDEALRDATRERETALEAEAWAAADETRRAGARLGLDLERALLIEARVILAELEAEAAGRLLTLLDDALAVRLVEELLPELEGPGWKIMVDAGLTDAVRRRLGQGYDVVEAAVGGAVAERGGRTLDNSLRARLRRALPALEPELARLLFEGAA